MSENNIIAVSGPSRQRKYGGGKFRGKSERQRRWMWANVPDAAKKWAHGRKTNKADWAGKVRSRPTVRRTIRADAEEVTMPEITIGAATEEDIAVIMQCLVASGISLTLQGDEIEVEEEEIPEEDLQASAAIVAAIAEITRPAEWFTPIQLDEPQRWTTVTADGEVWGHTALWGECHVGYPGRCVTPEMITKGGFDYANGIGHVVTADGAQVGTSPIAIKGGHAHKDWDWRKAQAHYDDPSTVVADVVYGTDEHGITFHGGIRPTATPEMIYTLRASGVSGDWREIEGITRFLASCCVNSGGYPKMKARVQGDRVLSLVAAGGPPEPDPTLSCCGPIEIVEESDDRAIIASLEERFQFIEAEHKTEVLASLSERLTDA